MKKANKEKPTRMKLLKVNMDCEARTDCTGKFSKLKPCIHFDGEKCKFEIYLDGKNPSLWEKSDIDEIMKEQGGE